MLPFSLFVNTADYMVVSFEYVLLEFSVDKNQPGIPCLYGQCEHTCWSIDLYSVSVTAAVFGHSERRKKNVPSELT